MGVSSPALGVLPFDFRNDLVIGIDLVQFAKNVGQGVFIDSQSADRHVRVVEAGLVAKVENGGHGCEANDHSNRKV